MTTKAKPRETAAKRPISITAVVDAVGALAAGDTQGHLYMYDTNRAGGSTGFGTEELRTRANRGDVLLWNCLALECEAYVSIENIVIDPEVCEPVRKVYPGTDVSYWTGTVKKTGPEPVAYRIAFKLGTRDEPITATLSSSLVGQ
ncbi:MULTISPECIES: hypothetical protein [unclassified Streptomyces]|uniref:hypothetical protein n=1 Tax=unclassified Streptomyces TaxID=2593676 RepID=UPI000748CC4B|nr:MULTISPECIES: hypothetical protein [unclassified Streptomyces]KUL57592.1 hypothetical protein ADL30_11485 [Streptomyces sp. NRRL S-1521]THC49334.1 hypothetical protein E7X58_21045 [Streptomyces sp. A1499]